MQTTIEPFTNEIALHQELLRPAPTPVGGNVDYRQAKRELDDIDRLLVDSGVESTAVAKAICSSDLYARFRRVIDSRGIRGVSKSSLES